MRGCFYDPVQTSSIITSILSSCLFASLKKDLTDVLDNKSCQQNCLLTYLEKIISRAVRKLCHTYTRRVSISDVEFASNK